MFYYIVNWFFCTYLTCDLNPEDKEVTKNLNHLFSQSVSA